MAMAFFWFLYITTTKVCVSQPFVLWNSVTVPQENDQFATALYDDEIILVSGWNVIDAVYSISINNLSFNIWELDNNINVPFTAQRTYYSGQSSVQINDKLYGIPAYFDSNNDLQFAPNLFIFDLINRIYVNPATYSYQLYQETYAPCIIAINNELYIIGGYNDQFIYSTSRSTDLLQIYSILNNSWSFGANLKIGRYNAGCASNINKEYIFLFAGYAGFSNQIGSIEQYDITNDNWILLNASLSIPREDLKCILSNFNGYIYCIGGSKRDGKGTSHTEIFDPKTKKMIFINDTLFDTVYPRRDFGLIQTDDNRLLVISDQVYNNIEEILLTPSPTTNPTVPTNEPTINPTVIPTVYPSVFPSKMNHPGTTFNIPTYEPTIFGVKSDNNTSNAVTIVVVIILVIFIAIGMMIGFYFYRKRKQQIVNDHDGHTENNVINVNKNNVQMQPVPQNIVQNQVNQQQNQLIMVQMPDGRMMAAQVMPQSVQSVQPVSQYQPVQQPSNDYNQDDVQNEGIAQNGGGQQPITSGYVYN